MTGKRGQERGQKRMRRAFALLVLLVVALPRPTHGEDGGRLWLRYDPIADAARRASVRAAVTSIVMSPGSPTRRAAADELVKAKSGLLGAPVPLNDSVHADGAVVAGTPKSERLIAALGWTDPLAAIGSEGFLIRSTRVGSHAVTVIAANTDIGVMYGAFHSLQLIQT